MAGGVDGGRVDQLELDNRVRAGFIVENISLELAQSVGVHVQPLTSDCYLLRKIGRLDGEKTEDPKRKWCFTLMTSGRTLGKVKRINHTNGAPPGPERQLTMVFH